MVQARVDRRRRWLWIFTSRPRLLAGLICGVCAGAAAAYVSPSLSLPAAATIGWDAMCLVYMASVSAAMYGHDPDDIRARAAREDEGRGIILALVLIAAAVSVIAIGAQLSAARSEHGVAKAAHVGLAFGTVAASWLMVQLVFALHYAHEYYDENRAQAGADMKGLAFPGGELPDYWDFVHFSFVIGVAAQTADIAFTSKELRRIGTVHSLVAFAFNTVIVALTINLLAGLF
jgi:uncharacterized membrane protein